ncbi:Mu transposase C-terminal domain-containing protein [Streptomyces sp. NPDC095817]|uniref:Mu transposase C-terminal domain-containing protein n=1 Tax=Streptomyces sp. NPDC095817 TaxID=3155082 RepID=UPI0033275ADC
MTREWRVIGPGGVRINNRTYDAGELGPSRRQPSGAGPDSRLWEVHYDPYDISCVWVRNHRGKGWITATWRHLRTWPVPWVTWSSTGPTRCWPNALAAGRTRRKSRKLPLSCWTERPTVPAGRAGRPARRDKGGHRTADRRDWKVAARTRATSTAAWPRPKPPAADPMSRLEPDPDPKAAEETEEVAKVVPLGIFDACEKAKRWW